VIGDLLLVYKTCLVAGGLVERQRHWSSCHQIRVRVYFSPGL